MYVCHIIKKNLSQANCLYTKRADNMYTRNLNVYIQLYTGMLLQIFPNAKLKVVELCYPAIAAISFVTLQILYLWDDMTCSIQKARSCSTIK